MVGWPHRLNGHESEQTLGVGEGQGGLCAAVHGVTESDTTEQLSNNSNHSLWGKPVLQSMSSYLSIL